MRRRGLPPGRHQDPFAVVFWRGSKDQQETLITPGTKNGGRSEQALADLIGDGEKLAARLRSCADEDFGPSPFVLHKDDLKILNPLAEQQRTGQPDALE